MSVAAALLALSGCTGAAVLAVDSAAEVEPEVCINELMSSNGSALYSGQDTPDWIELHNAGEQRVELEGWGISDDGEQPYLHTFGDQDALEPGGFLLLFADGQQLPFELSAKGGEVALFQPNGDGVILHHPKGERDFSWARERDCCWQESCWEATWLGTPGASNTPAELEARVLVPAGSDWHYQDGAEEPGWWEPDFDDGAWAEGPAPLGYGDAHQITTLDFGADPNNKRTTAWFRLDFELEQEPGELLDIALLHDDGAAVYLNGEELLRVNLPEGELGYDTLALEAVGGAAETAYYRFRVEGGLRQGDNVLAVELHQASPGSSDMGFDLELSVVDAVEN